MVRAVQLLVFLLPLALADHNPNAIIKASNRFANKLYQRLAQESSGNLVVSPFGLHLALTMVQQGAVENTAAELETVLGFSDANWNIGESYKSVLTGLQDGKFKIANKLFPAKNFQANPDYVSQARKYFLSGLENVDYTKPQQAATTINRYVEEKTNRKIHNLVRSDLFSELTRLVVVNAVHFQAKWDNNFLPAFDGMFWASRENRVPAKIMSQTNNFEYKEFSQLDAKVLKMDYEDGDYSMIFVLPNKIDGLDALEAKLVGTSLEDILEGLEETQVEVSIPKFRIENDLELEDTLAKMGAVEVFDEDRARLDKMGTGDQMHVSEVLQKAFLHVYEEGTEAAAGTAVDIAIPTSGRDNEPAVFRADHPFFFGLVKENSVLFYGRFVKP